ncbi:MAG TPA: pyruvate kinase [Phycisphaerae bacterium]|nr:pyruvate kinase [Phycisphaerae bacterium]
MIIRTKIVATVGPASGSRERLEDLARAGADVFRINFSHGSDEQHGEFLRNIRAAEAALGEPLAVMGDLCGPKIRVGGILGGGILLGDGQEIAIRREPVEGNAMRVSTTLPELVDAVEVGQGILLDDGKIRLRVVAVEPPEQIVCEVVRGGVLASGKGINLPSTALPVAALTEKDRRDAAWIARRDFDYVALSFVRTAGDVRELRALLDAAGCGARIVAKIEKPQAVENIEEIIDAADAVMVARGDLGVEMDLPAVPVAQKRIARLCQAAGTCCIIATQMLETMTHSPTPTRAEVSDVANAVLDHADAVMLSGETAVGEFPAAAVRMMNDIVRQTQAYHDETSAAVRVVHASARTVAALAAGVKAMLAAEDIAAVAVYTATGTTARLLAKSRLPCPILAMAADVAVVRRMCLYYGVAARQAPAPEHTREVLKLAERFAADLGVAKRGDRIVVVSGRPIGRPGAANTLVVHEVG